MRASLVEQATLRVMYLDEFVVFAQWMQNDGEWSRPMEYGASEFAEEFENNPKYHVMVATIN